MQNVAKMTFTIETNFKKELDSFAQELNLSKSKLITNALEYYFDALDLQIAHKRLEKPKIITKGAMQEFVNGL